MQEGQLNPLISVVIPVFNVEKYLEKCVDSVLVQSYDNFEVILIDDGSTDSSGKICDRYAEKDSRISVYHKLNGGLSDARNYGVAHANGDLISFIDSDDYVTADYLDYLWYLMDKYHCDISCAAPKSVYDGAVAFLKEDNIKEAKLDTGRALERICCVSFGAWARLYKKQILLKHPFPVGKLYEDIATVYKLIDECEEVAFSDKQVYVWLQREGSITHAGINERQLDIFWALDELYDFMCKSYAAYKNAASYRYIMETIDFLSRVFNHCNEADKKKYFTIARKKALPHLKEASECWKASFRFKIASLGIYAGYFFYKMLFILKKIQKGHKSIVETYL